MHPKKVGALDKQEQKLENLREELQNARQLEEQEASLKSRQKEREETQKLLEEKEKAAEGALKIQEALKELQNSRRELQQSLRLEELEKEEKNCNEQLMGANGKKRTPFCCRKPKSIGKIWISRRSSIAMRLKGLLQAKKNGKFFWQRRMGRKI